MTTLERIGDTDRTSDCDIVFVHGLNGKARETWQSAARPGGDFWPRWVADAHPNAAVWTVGYEAAPLAWFGKAMSIQMRATNLLALMSANGIGDRPLAFITHSLGGLIVKAMLCEADGAGAKEFGGFAGFTRLIAFVAVPHVGSRIANYLDALREILPSSAATADLKYAEANLIELNDWFRAYVQDHQPAIVSFFETVPVRGAIVVPRESADFGFPHHVCVPDDFDHIEIAKPRDPKGVVAGRTEKALKRFTDEARAAAPAAGPAQAPAALTYSRPTAIDLACVEALAASKGGAAISYAPLIAEAAQTLRSRDMNPDGYLDEFPGLEDRDEAGRRRLKASLHAANSDLLVRVDRIISYNDEGLNRLISRLRDLGALRRQAAALGAYATFSALRLIQALGAGFEVKGGQTRRLFESYIFSSDGSFGPFDCVPGRSDTGQLAFGYRSWVSARVGHERGFEKVTMPMRVALPLFREGRQGDSETFFAWVLPQIAAHSSQPLESFPMDWEAFVLAGANGVEWWIRSQPSPWEGTYFD